MFLTIYEKKLQNYEPVVQRMSQRTGGSENESEPVVQRIENE
jgi:hypothetical protein